ncbi:hypothetical protein [Granulicella sp. L46]|jgi:hypothetical protein|uniref:hypothetical protein n=1 Tax=Granulicella sp. L46 TaxID=1641865 RepID=UPI001C209005|nr:hypothetical protein [Granulicella sp. L46]
MTPRETKTILMVEGDPTLRHSRDLLLSTLGIPIRVASDYKDVCLSDSGCFCLVTISLSPSQTEAAKVAELVRRRWPTARILLLGTLSAAIDDPLYDEIVDARFNPSALVEACQRLLGTSGADLGVRRER